jgi:hypothetical protein
MKALKYTAILITFKLHGVNANNAVLNGSSFKIFKFLT